MSSRPKRRVILLLFALLLFLLAAVTGANAVSKPEQPGEHVGDL